MFTILVEQAGIAGVLGLGDRAVHGAAWRHLGAIGRPRHDVDTITVLQAGDVRNENRMEQRRCLTEKNDERERPWSLKPRAARYYRGSELHLIKS